MTAGFRVGSLLVHLVGDGDLVDDRLKHGYPATDRDITNILKGYLTFFLPILLFLSSISSCLLEDIPFSE